MKLISINIGRAQSITTPKKTFKTGIYKQPVDTPVQVTAEGLAGDVISNKQHHGGVDQAVYIYGSDDYDWWAGELDRTISPGTFGENLTISDLESASFNVGDRLYIGDNVILEVTAPRIPCDTFAAKMGDPTFIKRFRKAERPGLYCRVIQTGDIQAGDPVRLESCEGETVTVIETFHDFYRSNLSEEKLRRYLAAPIAVRDRVSKEKKLARLLEKTNSA